MTDTYLLYDDCLRSYELRHEIGEAIMDPLPFVEHDGRRIVVAGPFEVGILEKRDDVIDEVWRIADFGTEDLINDPGFPQHLVGEEVVYRVLLKLGVTEVCVPPSFRTLTADYLREKGIKVVVDPRVWMERRRRKTPWELEGIERAQRAAETAMLTAARVLREAERTKEGFLRFEGEPLTAELIRTAMVAELLSQGAQSEDILVQCGDIALSGHDLGMGPIMPDTSVVIDCFPRDRRTGVYSDMTRTFVAGDPSDELKNLHTHCKHALEIAYESIKPGTKDAFQKVAEYFEAQGFPTQLTHKGPGSLREGFMHSLGHGVGLAVHERPWLGRRADEFVEGDVVAVEPGLYFAGIGGVRLEDTVLVTESGVEHFTDPYPYDLTP
jgi:Xaa-Pro aminopeptidase